MSRERADAAQRVVDEVVAELQATRLEAFVAAGEVAADTESISSKLGGRPWWPESEPVPAWPDGTARAGTPLSFLAQVNLSELPFDDVGSVGDGERSRSAGSIGELPRGGLVQVWVDGEMPFGLEFGSDANVQRGWRLTYWHPDRLNEPALTAWSPAMQGDDFPLMLEDDQCIRLRFSVAATMTADALGMLYDFDDTISDHAERLYFRRESERAEKLVAGSPPPAQIGGHPHVNQQDPRRGGWGRMLLLQLGTHGDVSMWADDGAAHFFVDGPDPAAWDERTFYSWDSG